MNVKCEISKICLEDESGWERVRTGVCEAFYNSQFRVKYLWCTCVWLYAWLSIIYDHPTVRVSSTGNRFKILRLKMTWDVISWIKFDFVEDLYVTISQVCCHDKIVLYYECCFLSVHYKTLDDLKGQHLMRQGNEGGEDRKYRKRDTTYWKNK